MLFRKHFFPPKMYTLMNNTKKTKKNKLFLLSEKDYSISIAILPFYCKDRDIAYYLLKTFVDIAT